ncbi:unnamed protein product, partial [Rotaria sp. Silwood1]
DEQPELVSWTPTALKIKERIEEVIEQKLNHALIQYYRNGKDYIGEHSDITLDISIGSNIVNYSLGAARTMILKHKTQNSLKQRFKLPHNSLFIMGWKTNREWFHSIKQDKRLDMDKDSDELAFSSQRISLTLRTIATFRNRRTGQLYGQGAKNKTVKQISEHTSNESDEQDMLMAFTAENQQSSDFDWNHYYGNGFDALNFKDKLKCDWDGQCQINISNRHICSYCRLRKCFASGMKVELFQCSRSQTGNKNRKRKNVTDSTLTPSKTTTSKVLIRFNESEQFPTLNLLRSDQSTLTIEQWNLISNLLNCFNEHSGLSKSERYVFEQNKLPLKYRFKSTSIINLYQVLLDDNQSLYINNRDFRSLSIEDRSIILHNTIVHIGNLSSNFILYKIGLLNQSVFYDAIESFIPPPILSFSTFNSTTYSNISPMNLSNHQQLLDIQNKYIELTWRYLLYKYNFQQAVILFSDLIRCFFVSFDVFIHGYETDWVIETYDSLVLKSEQNLIMND